MDTCFMFQEHAAGVPAWLCRNTCWYDNSITHTRWAHVMFLLVYIQLVIEFFGSGLVILSVVSIPRYYAVNTNGNHAGTPSSGTWSWCPFSVCYTKLYFSPHPIQPRACMYKQHNKPGNHAVYIVVSNKNVIYGYATHAGNKQMVKTTHLYSLCIYKYK